MRALRTTLAAAWLLALIPHAAPAADETVKKLLSFRPSLKGVEYEVPTDPAAVAACKAETVPGGYQLRDGQGKILCRFVDRDGNKVLDQWSYYVDGFENYREVDLNGDSSLDEVRWMNSGGTRVAKVAPGPKGSGVTIVSWNRISAEEASKVFVQAVALGDLNLLETVMVSAAELEALGIPKGEVDQVAVAEKQRLAQVKALRGVVMVSGWDNGTTWSRFDASLPHLIPSDAGVKSDVLLYENAVIFAISPAMQNSPEKVAFLQVGEMVKVGETWKFVDLPRVVNKEGVVPVVEGGIRSWVYRSDAGAAGAAENPAIAEAMQALAAFDNSKANQALQTSGVPKDLARFHVARVAPLKQVVKAAEMAGDAKIELDYHKLIVDSLAAAYATGQYAAGAKVLEEMEAKGGKIGSYAAFKLIEAEFALQNAGQGNFIAIQKDWLAKLKAFVEKYPQCDEAPQALLLLASTHDMNGDEPEAKTYYATLVKGYPATEWGKKAAGALRRLDLVGKPFAMKGTDLRGQTIDASQYRGKTLLVTFWASWAGPAKRDLPELSKLQAKYKGKNFEVVGVNLDNEKADLDATLQASPLAWPQLYEPGGMESRLAVEFGIISLPTMILVDPDGKVINRSLRSASELEVQLDKMLTGKVALAPGS